MSPVVIVRPQGQGIPEACAGAVDACGGDVCVVRRRPVLRAVEIPCARCRAARAVFIGAGKVRNIAGIDRPLHICDTAKMNENRVPLSRRIQVVQPAGSQISDARQVLPVRNNRHLAGDSALLHDFIEHIRPADAIGGLCRLVRRHHDRERPLIGQRRRDRKARVDAGEAVADIGLPGQLLPVRSRRELSLAAGRRLCRAADGGSRFRGLLRHSIFRNAGVGRLHIPSQISAKIIGIAVAVFCPELRIHRGRIGAHIKSGAALPALRHSDLYEMP